MLKYLLYNMRTIVSGIIFPAIVFFPLHFFVLYSSFVYREYTERNDADARLELFRPLNTLVCVCVLCVCVYVTR